MKTPLISLLLGGGLLLAAGCMDSSEEASFVSVPERPLAEAKTPSASYTLRPTDLLRVSLYQEPDFNADAQVDQAGDVILPLIGRVHVAGKTLTETQLVLTERLKRFYKEPSLTLLILKYAERKVYIDGMVGHAGPVLFPPEEKLTIGKAISIAGGILPRGERSDVKLTRIVDGKEQTITVDMTEINSGRTPDIELQENDRIYVRDSRI